MVVNTRLTICVGLFVLGQLVGCGVKPEANSGGDAYRHTAEQLVMEEWVDGELAYGNGDRTDWKKFELDQASMVYLSLNLDLPGSGAELGVYNRVGVPLGSVTKGEGATKPATLAVNAPTDGLFFIRIRATGGEPTSYSVKASLSADSDTNNSDVPDF
tara:strand:- start:306 stop:779 length:474 start_codon:yes stop_codon:yes gene_type:complete